MDDRKEYAALRIPQRETMPANESAQSAAVDSAYAATQICANFAEIEIGAPPSTNSQHSSLNFQLPQPIQPRVIDPIREKFYEMRRMASNRPFARNDSELFYRQAKFMENFTDDYKGDAKFNMYYPYYQNMGYEYLRTYFTWRTKARDGAIQPTSLSYVFLYIYELLSSIGTNDPTDGLNKLLVIWNSFSQEYPAIEKYLPKWLKDYHIFYEMPHSFYAFVEEHHLQRHYSLTLLFNENTENKLELWNGISGYDVTNSKFYNDGNQELMSKCFEAVFCGIQNFCTKRNTRFEDLLIYSVGRRFVWQPFKQALFYSRTSQTDREIKISEFERYYCKNGQWTANLPIYYSSQKDFVGYVLKKTEACLRQAVNYKFKLVADIKPGSKPFRELQRPAAKRAELDKVIENAVKQFYSDMTRTIVKVDQSNLTRIREEALGTQEQLIVPEDKGTVHLSCFTETSHEDTAKAKSKTDEPSPCLTLSYSDGWKVLREALSDVERKALSVAIYGGASIKALADENGIMLEVLADGINEKAADYIGDSILELGEDMIIYDEYRDDIIGMVG